jgi:hypothetical protein
MHPTTDAGKLIWGNGSSHREAGALTIFAYELIRGRRLAKAKQDTARRWSERHAPSLAEPPSKKPETALSDPWASRAANNAY